MFFEIITLFPSMFDGVFTDSILKRAIEGNFISVSFLQLRDFSDDSHRTVDDYPFGGGPGMVLKPEPLSRAIGAAREKHRDSDAPVIFLSPKGRLLDHRLVTELCRHDGLILLCGRYKGIDNRIRENEIDDEISIGDYVLSGGEIPAMVIVDSVTRLISGVLGNPDSAAGDSFFNGLLSPPCFTRPEVFKGKGVPEIMRSGHHERIRMWEKQKAEETTRCMRPDLWQRWCKANGNETSDAQVQKGYTLH